MPATQVRQVAAAQRLEDPHHWPSLKQLDRAAKVLGKRLVLSLE